MSQDSLQRLSDRLRDFARERDWEQFHSPKNLAMALIAEAAELVEHFQWLSEEQSYQLPPDKKQEVAMRNRKKLSRSGCSSKAPWMPREWSV